MTEVFTSIGFFLQAWVQENNQTAHAVSANIFVEPIAIEVEIEEIPSIIDTCEIPAFFDFFGEEKKIIENAVEKLPCELLEGLEKVNIYDNPERPRAMTSATRLYLRDDFFELEEAEKVLVHELAHIADLSGIRSENYKTASSFKDGHATIFSDDPSVDFYKISWKNNSQWKTNSQEKDFITGYAASDPFEDFSESVVMYVYNGNTFRTLAKHSPALQTKYDFLKNNIFEQEEFVGGSIPTNMEKREWDSTKL